MCVSPNTGFHFGVFPLSERYGNFIATLTYLGVSPSLGRAGFRTISGTKGFPELG